MSLDAYSPCPCGSGKKLKFCCSDLAGEIQKIEKLVSGEQPHAALRHVEHLLEKQPQRASLLDLKASIELSLGELDAARATIQQYLIAHPENPSAYGQAAIMAAAQGETSAAVGALQEALERIDEKMPQRVFEAIGSVGHALLLAGDMVAARGHLLLYAGISGEQRNKAIELLLRMNLQGGLPLLLRDELHLREAPAEAAWKARFDEANRLVRRGLWQRAEAEYVALDEETPEQPAVVYNLALVRGWLGDSSQFASGMHRFAALESADQGKPTDDAVEAEALAQLIDPDLDEPKLETVRITHPVTNADAASERLDAHDQASHYQLDPDSLDDSAAAQPRKSYILLDRPVPATGVDLKIDEAPNILAFLSLYGKRTDRDAVVELTTDRGEHFEEVEKLLSDILGDVLQAQTATAVAAEKPAGEEALSWRWRLPDDTPPAHRRELLAQRRRQAILEDWVAAPRGALKGVSPRDAAGQAELLLPLLGSVLIIEQAAVDPDEVQLFDQLREQLELPQGSTAASEDQPIERVPLVRLARLQIDKASNAQLQELLNRCVMTGANLAILRIASELVDRLPQNEAADEDAIDYTSAYRQLIRAEPNPDRALEWVKRAKAWSAAADESAAEWAVLELELQIERGNTEGLQAALNQIRDEHMHEPGVAEAVYRLLYSAGLMPPEGADRPPAGASEPSGSGLWTPESDRAEEAPAESKSAIWTP